LNARDTLAAMPATDAQTMTNMEAYADRVDTRAGFTLDATLTSSDATSGNIDSLVGLFKSSAAPGVFAFYTWKELVGGSRKTRLAAVNVGGGIRHRSASSWWRWARRSTSSTSPPRCNSAARPAIPTSSSP
jgi:hypothetical protein